MWHFQGVKTYSDPSYIFSRVQDPQPPGSTPLLAGTDGKGTILRPRAFLQLPCSSVGEGNRGRGWLDGGLAVDVFWRCVVMQRSWDVAAAAVRAYSVDVMCSVPPARLTFSPSWRLQCISVCSHDGATRTDPPPLVAPATISDILIGPPGQARPDPVTILAKKIIRDTDTDNSTVTSLNSPVNDELHSPESSSIQWR